MATRSPSARTQSRSANRVTRTYRQSSDVLRFAVRALLWSMLIAYGFCLTWLSVMRYTAYNSGMLDIGNMAQAIGSVQRGEPLVSTYQMGSMSRLALHVELIYLLFAPFYALWSDPRLLLIAQAVLFTLGALPIYWIAIRHKLHEVAAFSVVLTYLFYPVAVTSVLFDFHGDTLAIPMLLYTIDALDRRAWRRYMLFVALSLSCKVYVALPIALIGVLAWWYFGERRAALWTVSVAVVYGAFAFFVVRPFFVTEDTPSTQSGLNYVAFYFGNLEQVFATWRDRWFHVRIVLGPAILLSLVGISWFIAGLPVVLATAISTGPGPAYAYWYHHYALAIPFIIMASIAGAERIRGRGIRTQQWRNNLATAMAVTVAFLTVLANHTHVDTPFQGAYWQLPQLTMRDLSYTTMARDALKDRIIAEDIPSLVPVAASPFIAPHLTDRSTLYLTSKLGSTYPYTFTEVLPKVDYVFADALFDHRLSALASIESPAIADVMRDPAFGLLRSEDGLLVFKRDLPVDQRLLQQIEIRTGSVGPDVPPERRFGTTLDLLDVQLTPTANKRLRASFAWSLQGTERPYGRFVAVSRIEGIDTYRIVHLPTYIFRPLEQWQPGEIVAETFDVALPEGLAPGTYTWTVGWYDLATFEGQFTDYRSELPGAVSRAIATFEVTSATTSGSGVE